VATDLHTHRQVLTREIACLVAPDPGALAGALARLLADPAERRRLAEAARQVADTRYSRETYVGRTRDAYRRLMGGAPLPRPSRAAVAPPTGKPV
jgi:glycosyltransferase involved in cell wall biosynthesis